MRTDYDLIVVGAGIQGAAVAQAAGAAGYRALVVEQYGEPACGTSSRSSKLIHGGLRYLESSQFRLVRECLVERARLLRNAPHLVTLVPFHIPIYPQTTRRPLKIVAGLSLYSLFSLKPFHHLPRRRWGELDGLNTRDLQHVFVYHDARTDDALLTRAVLASAQSLGCEAWFDTAFVSAQVTAHGCEVAVSRGGASQTITAAALINCAGPWALSVAQRIEPATAQPRVELVAGSHIELPGRLRQGIYYLEAPQDRRAVFVMPWHDHILVGTTEQPYRGDPARVQPLDSEIAYLLDVYNHYFTSPKERADVIGSFAGLRVLPSGEGSAFSRPRGTRVVADRPERPRVLHVYGGKLTAYRSTAEDLVDRLRATLPERRKIADTRSLRLPQVG